MLFTLRMFLVFTDGAAFVNDSEGLFFPRSLSRLSRRGLTTLVLCAHCFKLILYVLKTRLWDWSAPDAVNFPTLF